MAVQGRSGRDEISSNERTPGPAAPTREMIQVGGREIASPAPAQLFPDPTKDTPYRRRGCTRRDVTHSQINRQRRAPRVERIRNSRVELSL